MTGPFTAHDIAVRDFVKHLRERWIECICASCADTFFKKPSKPGDTCGSFECERGYAFLNAKPPRRQFMTPLRIAQKFSDFFQAAGHSHAPAVPLTGHNSKHIFTGTAGQVFDGTLFENQPYDTHSYFVRQPVIRMRPSKYDGFLKGFVNISLERLDSDAKAHLSALEDYLDFLSNVGMYVGDLRLKVYEDRPDWGTGEFRSAVIGIYHDGLEIGVLNYFTDIPRRDRDLLTMSDVSFGLERVTWSLSRTRRFVDTVGPAMELARDTPHDLLDAYRTITLMMLSGVTPERHTQAGSKLRSLYLSAISPTAPIRYDLIEYYYNWWTNFTQPVMLLDSVIDRWRHQLARQLSAALSVPLLSARSPEDVVTSLITRGVVDPRRLGGEKT